MDSDIKPAVGERLTGRLTFAAIQARRQQQAAEPPAPPPPPPARAPENSTQRKWREALAVLDILRERYPNAFTKGWRPLAIGIHNQILAECGCDRQALKAALRYWTKHPGYLAKLAKGGPRIGLNGAPCGEVSAEQREAAAKALGPAREREKARRLKQPLFNGSQPRAGQSAFEARTS